MAFLTRASRHVAERAKFDLPDLDGVLSLTTISMLLFIRGGGIAVFVLSVDRKMTRFWIFDC